MGTLVIQPCLGSQKKIEKMLNGKKKEKTPAFNEFAPRVLNFQRRANWMSNAHIRADWVSNIQFSPLRLRWNIPAVQPYLNPRRCSLKTVRPDSSWALSVR